MSIQATNWRRQAKQQQAEQYHHGRRLQPLPLGLEQATGLLLTLEALRRTLRLNQDTGCDRAYPEEPLHTGLYLILGNHQPSNSF